MIAHLAILMLAAHAPVERMAAVVDYVAADYAGAVQDGRVVAESEYQEQQAMLGEARAILGELTPLPGHEPAHARLAQEFAALDKDFRARAPDQAILRRARVIHERLIEDYGLTLAPLGPPSMERAKEVYAQACASCHGADGRAQTDQARELKPPPLSFFDEKRMVRVAPEVAFHALTFGIAGTGMASFDTLPASDRWSLAFYTVAMRHAGRDVERGRAAFERAQVPIAQTASRLAALSDDALDAALRSQLPDPAERGDAIAYLRRVATFAEAPGGKWAQARRLVQEVAEHAGDRKRAGELAISAYLEGVEPHEPMLRAHDRPLADRIERAFFELRQTIARGADEGEVRKQVARTLLVLDGADERGAGGRGRGVPFFAAFAIAVREGFELSLLLAALLAFLRKSGHGEHARYIHLGWAAAVPAGLVTWFAIGAALRGAQRELTEGILTLFAAAMLLFVSHFVIGRLESRKWLRYLEKKTTRAAGARVPWPLVTVAFVTAYREAIEIVLFFRALVLDAPGGGALIALGALAGIGVLVVLIQAMSRLGRRLNPRPLMLISSILLTAIALSLVGQGVKSLQEGGYVPVSPIGWNVSIPLAAQAIVLLLVLVPVWVDRRSRT